MTNSSLVSTVLVLLILSLSRTKFTFKGGDRVELTALDRFQLTMETSRKPDYPYQPLSASVELSDKAAQLLRGWTLRLVPTNKGLKPVELSLSYHTNYMIPYVLRTGEDYFIDFRPPQFATL